MDRPAPQEFILDAFADPASVRDVVRGILHTIFFHRFFPPLSPRSRDVLHNISLPYVDDAELDTMIEGRTAELARDLDALRSTSDSGSSNGGRGTITVQFFEKRRRKAWYGAGRDEEVCWESWTLKVAVAEPRTDTERAKVRRATEQTLTATALKIITCVNAHKDHIPPILTSDANPFPYQIHVNQRGKNLPASAPAGSSAPSSPAMGGPSTGGGGGGGGAAGPGSAGGGGWSAATTRALGIY